MIITKEMQKELDELGMDATFALALANLFDEKVELEYED
jgi:hypothetical protein